MTIRCFLFLLSLCAVSACSEDVANETSIELGGATASVGLDVSRPEWLPKWYVLPEGITIQTASTDPQFGQSIIYGVVNDQLPEQVLAQQIAMLEAQGYVQTERSRELRIKATHVDGTYVELTLDRYGQQGTQYRLQLHDASSADALRAREVATAFDGTGTLTAVIGDQSFELTGTCRVEGRQVKFASDTGQTELYADGQAQPNTLRGSVAFVRGEAISGWTPARATPDGVTSTVAVSANGFSYQGGLFEVIQTQLMAGQLDMECRR